MESKFVWTEIKVLRYAQYYCNNPKWFSYKGTQKSEKKLEDFKEAYVREVGSKKANVKYALAILKREGYKISNILNQEEV
tara:strand:+ start:269 stop:508 length:240 start_codon:yes stop_codon:yes gene_type:complete